MKNDNVPNHVAIIYDGNRRWAKRHGLSEAEGHKAGAKNVVDNVVRFAKDYDIKYLTFWLFSTENWKRDEKEVSFIWNLFRKYFDEFFKEFSKEKIRFHHIGRKDRLPKDIIDSILKLEKDTESFEDHHLCLALDYGGRDEILHATKEMIRLGLKPEDVTEENFSKYLYTKDIPDPDLIIRTSGELRFSGFMAWQGTYAELFVSDKNGPDFDQAEFEKALESFSKRERRFGGDVKK